MIDQNNTVQSTILGLFFFQWGRLSCHIMLPSYNGSYLLLLIGYHAFVNLLSWLLEETRIRITLLSLSFSCKSVNEIRGLLQFIEERKCASLSEYSPHGNVQSEFRRAYKEKKRVTENDTALQAVVPFYLFIAQT